MITLVRMAINEHLLLIFSDRNEKSVINTLFFWFSPTLHYFNMNLIDCLILYWKPYQYWLWNHGRFITTSLTEIFVIFEAFRPKRMCMSAFTIRRWLERQGEREKYVYILTHWATHTMITHLLRSFLNALRWSTD